ncbi:hypothetical protein ACFQX6_54660 [Streptosporangium lutulentum]
MPNPTDDHVIETTKPRPRAVAALVLGHFIEVYDTALYGLFVAPIATAFFPAGNADAALIATLAVFGVSFLSSRPEACSSGSWPIGSAGVTR